MPEMKALLHFSDSFPGAERTVIRKAFSNEGIDTETAEFEMSYTGGAL